jgi:ubiquitin C-terminal hydrolase
MIFDKLETGLGQWKQVIEGVYGGKTCNQMICKGCNYIREKEELFYNLSVQVKGVKHIHESLKSYISGETISDFYCEACEKKNDIVRR